MPQQVTTASGHSRRRQPRSSVYALPLLSRKLTSLVPYFFGSTGCSFQFGRTSILLPRPPHLVHPGASYAAMLIPYKLDLFM